MAATMGEMLYHAGLYDESKYGKYEEFIYQPNMTHIFNEAKYNTPEDARERFIMAEMQNIEPGEKRDQYIRENKIDFDKFDRRMAPHLFNPETGERYFPAMKDKEPGPITMKKVLEEQAAGITNNRRLQIDIWDDYSVTVSAAYLMGDWQCNPPTTNSTYHADFDLFTNCALPYSHVYNKNGIDHYSIEAKVFHAAWSPCAHVACDVWSGDWPTCTTSAVEAWHDNYGYCGRVQAYMHYDGEVDDAFDAPPNPIVTQPGSPIYACPKHFPAMDFSTYTNAANEFVPGSFDATDYLFDPGYCPCDPWDPSHELQDWVPFAYWISIGSAGTYSPYGGGACKY